MRASAREVRGNVLAALGRVEEARIVLERAAELFGRKGSVPDVARVRGRLGELDG